MTDQWHIESWNEDLYRHYKKKWMKYIKEDEDVDFSSSVLAKQPTIRGED
jgi:hypothetical protein